MLRVGSEDWTIEKRCWERVVDFSNGLYGNLLWNESSPCFAGNLDTFQNNVITCFLCYYKVWLPKHTLYWQRMTADVPDKRAEKVRICKLTKKCRTPPYSIPGKQQLEGHPPAV